MRDWEGLMDVQHLCHKHTISKITKLDLKTTYKRKISKCKRLKCT